MLPGLVALATMLGSIVWGGPEIMAVGLLLIVLTGWPHLGPIRRRREARRLAELAGEPGDHAVRIDVFDVPRVRNGRTDLQPIPEDGWSRLGADRGLVAFVDGWLVYRGERTEWAIRPSDVRDDLAATFFIDGGEGLTAVRIVALRGEAFRDEFLRWRHSPDPAGEPVFPPLLPDRPVTGPTFSVRALCTALSVPAALAVGGTDPQTVPGLILLFAWGLWTWSGGSDRRRDRLRQRESRVKAELSEGRLALVE